jgi:hypothetical protein
MNLSLGAVTCRAACESECVEPARRTLSFVLTKVENSCSAFDLPKLDDERTSRRTETTPARETSINAMVGLAITWLLAKLTFWAVFDRRRQRRVPA